MVKKRRLGAQERRDNPDGPTLVGAQIYALLEKLGASPQRSRLAELWKNWPEVVGPAFASVCALGHKDGTLLLGAEDAMECQELTLQGQEILDLVNAYLGDTVFTRVRVSILQRPRS